MGRLRPPCVLSDELPAAAEELKHIIVLNTHTDSSGKPSTNPQVQCVHRSHTLRGGATRIRGHLAHTQGCGVSFCDQVPADTKLHFREVHTSKLEIPAKKRRLAALDQLSHSDSVDSELSLPTLSQSFSRLRQQRQIQKLQSVSYEEECWSWEEESNDSDIDA